MEIEEYLSGFVKFTDTPSLEVMHWLMQEFGNPQNNINIIHVAGTNGKGSVCEMLNNVLMKAGYRVGKFISPHLITFHETICINNQPISEEKVQELLSPLASKIEEYNQSHTNKVTWFEVITSLALLYFGTQECDFVILETGMGGTYDCTNIVQSMLSIITSIGYDHMDILGHTIEEITKNKAGIIKQDSETVYTTQQDSVNEIIETTCRKKHSTAHPVEEKDVSNYNYDENYQRFDYRNYQQIEVNLKGKKQIQNAKLVIEAVEILQKKGYAISKETLREGLQTVMHPARFEVISEEPKIIFDGGHNEKAIANFKETVDQYFKEKKKTYIISILTTKDYATILEQLVQDSEATYVFTSGNDEKRYVSKEILYEEAKKYRVGNLEKRELDQAIDLAKQGKLGDTIFVVGSFYVYPTVLQILGK